MGQVGYVTGGLDEGPGRGVWGRHLDRGFSLGMWNMMGFGVGDVEQVGVGWCVLAADVPCFSSTSCLGPLHGSCAAW